MPSAATAAVPKGNDANGKTPDTKPRLLDSRRLSELLGFLFCVAGLLLLLSLGSYLAFDPSLDTSSHFNNDIHNWIGPAGSYTADVLFQALGWAAYLAPLALFSVGIEKLRARPIASPVAKGLGALTLMTSAAAILEMFPLTPMVGETIRGGGLVGYLVAVGLGSALSATGAWIVSAALFLTSLFLVTSFSFSSAADFIKTRWGATQALRARWSEWRESRRRERLRRKVELQRLIGKPPIVIERAMPNLAARPANPSALAATGTIKAGPAEGIPFATPPGTEMVEPAEASVPKPQGLGEAPERGEPVKRPAPKIVGRGSHAYKLPSATLLRPPEDQQSVNEDELNERAAQLTRKFSEFGVTGAVTQIHPGPVVTTYEFKPEAGIKYSRVTNLVDDLCLAMRAESILIERIPGKSTVGIEVPNFRREIIFLREIIESSDFAAAPSRLTLCLGKDITGKTRVGNLTEMPHLLIAGATGAGKSVALNAMIVSILHKSTPDEVKLILIDPKRLELGLYDGVPHLFTPIVTEPKQAANVLRRATVEMEERLKKLAAHGVRNIEQYNKIFEPDSTLDLFDASGQREQPLPYIVIVIDELADLMMVEPQYVEESITRLAQMARAVGIHLILATQRPSVDVITGLIKANLPSRMSFRVASKVDSRTILDSNGAEALLGRGDMLFMPPGTARLVRLHGPLVTEKEIGRVVDWWKGQSQPRYNDEFLKPFKEKEREADIEEEVEEVDAELDEVYDEAVRIVVESGKASTSLLQRRLRLGYGRAARLIDMMEKDGIVSAPDGSKPREVLKRPDWLEQVDNSLR